MADFYSAVWPGLSLSITSTDPATSVFQHYSAFGLGLSPVQFTMFGSLALLYLGILVGAVLHIQLSSGLGTKLVRVSASLLVPATIVTGEGGLYVFAWPAFLALAAAGASLITTVLRIPALKGLTTSTSGMRRGGKVSAMSPMGFQRSSSEQCARSRTPRSFVPTTLQSRA